MHSTNLAPTCTALALALLAAACSSATPNPARAAAPAPAPVGQAAPADEPQPEAAAQAAVEPVEPEPAPPAEALSAGDIVLARVNGVELTLSDAMATFSDSHGGHEILMRGEPTVRELAGRIIEYQLMIGEALALDLDQNQVVIDAIEERRQALSENLFFQREVDEKVAVSDEEVEAFYAKTERVVAITLVETAERGTCEALRARALAGESLAEIAAGESIHASKSSGGLIPFVRRGDLPPELDQAVFALAELGDMTEVVPSAQGFAFARLEQSTTNEQRPPREVLVPQIRRALEQRAKEQLRAQVEERVRAEGQAEVVAENATLEAVLDEQRDKTTVLARCAGAELTLGELQDFVDLPRLRLAAEEDARAAVDALVQEWILRKAVRDAARRMGLQEDPEIQAEVAQWRKDVLRGVLNQEYVYAGIEPTEDEMRDYFEAHRDSDFTRPAEARVAYLVVGTREAADAALSRLAAGEGFDAVYREVSTDTTFAQHGGRMGWIKEGEMLETVEAAVFAAEPGSYVGPIETDQGFFVVHLIEKRPRVPATFEQAREGARRAVEREQRLAAYDTWVQRLRERADITIDEAGIQRAVVWLEQEAERREAEKALEAPVESPHSTGGMMPEPPAMPPGAGGDQPEAGAGGGRERQP